MPQAAGRSTWSGSNARGATIAGGTMNEILTPRLRLRRATPADVDAMYGILRDARAMRYWSTPPHASPQETRVWLARMIDKSPDASDDFVIEHAGRVIGKAGCWRLPEVGFILHPDHWGKGLATEAMAAVVPRVFARFPAVPALEADVDPRNERSLSLLARLGFREVRRATRTWLVGTEWCDSVYLALPRATPPPTPPPVATSWRLKSE
jgi:[ribosomal protein S5]-alanine N-acetyltransferase